MCGAEFERVINEMTKDGPCPYCENKKVLAGYNGLKTTHPNIAKEWGIENYLLGIGGPEGYKYNSTKRVYWPLFIFSFIKNKGFFQKMMIFKNSDNMIN